LLQEITLCDSSIDPDTQEDVLLPPCHRMGENMFNPGRISDEDVRTSDTIPQGLARHLDASQLLNRAFASATPRKLAQGQRLWSEGDTRTHVYLIRSGSICLSRMLPDGRRVVVGFAFPGDLIGLGADWHSCDAEAMQGSRLDGLSSPVFQRLAHDDHEFAGLVRTEVGHALSDAMNHVVVVSKLTAAERIAHFLVSLSERNRRRGTSAASVVLPMRRLDIADFLGLTIETVSRTFTAFRKAQFIDMEHPSVVFLTGLPALARLASGAGAATDEVRRAA
jgi:CRP/FNR family transcriptional regulator, anaerobic regulatory protein